MFARISAFQGSPQNIEKEIQTVREEVLPKARALKGFKGFRMFVDRSSGKSLGITLWETEQDLKASEETANRLRKDVADKAGEKIISVERYEVVIYERA